MKTLNKKEYVVLMCLMFLAQGFSLFKIISLEKERDELMKNFFEMMTQNKFSFNDMGILGAQIYSNYENDILYWSGMLAGLTVISTIFYFIKLNKQSNEQSK